MHLYSIAKLTNKQTNKRHSTRVRELYLQATELFAGTRSPSTIEKSSVQDAHMNRAI